MMLAVILLGAAALGVVFGLAGVWFGLSRSEDHLVPL